MIETEQTVLVDAPIERVWDYVVDIQRWASLMPGMRECAMDGPDDSRWTLKVGVGGLVRTVNVLVHVEQWEQPERVTFTYKLQGDPVQGGGTYTATRRSLQETEIALKVQVVGSGAMAPMWEAMGKPLLPTLAKSFAVQLKTEIEKTAGAAPASPAAPMAEPVAAPSLFARLFGWLRKIWPLKPA